VVNTPGPRHWGLCPQTPARGGREGGKGQGQGKRMGGKGEGGEKGRGGGSLRHCRWG